MSEAVACVNNRCGTLTDEVNSAILQQIKMNMAISVKHTLQWVLTKIDTHTFLLW